MRSEVLSGWARTAPSRARVAALPGPDPETANELLEMLERVDGRGVLPRGLGRAYGDAAQNAGGTVVDTTTLDAPLEVSADGTARLGAGVSIDRLLRTAVPRGWFVPVTPGTRQVTIGGAIAADVHGKNHHVDGSMAAHVRAMTLVSPSGIHRLRQGDELFDATTGGMGLTGIVVEAELSLIPIETAFILVDTDRTTDLDHTIELMSEGDEGYQYSVAWIDCLTPGRSLGRAVLTRGNHAPLDSIGGSRRGTNGSTRDDARRFNPRTRLSAPPWVPPGLLNQASIRAFNEAVYRRAPRKERAALHSIGRFFHPLDGVRDWNRMYGRRGFLQYQCVVPFGRESTLRTMVERLSTGGCPAFFGVLKRFGPAGPGHLSFPVPGWTLALDMPVGPPALGPLLDELDGMVVEAGGRVYLAKDSRLRPERLAAMYPRLDEWRAVQSKVDPRGVMRSDLARRLELMP